MARSSVPLAEIRKTRFAQRITRAGVTGPECWGAETIDGAWDFDREDSPGTPWLIYHKPSVADRTCTTPVDQCGTLKACRTLVASGEASRQLERLKAHDRGEHKATRDSWCPRC